MSMHWSDWSDGYKTGLEAQIEYMESLQTLLRTHPSIEAVIVQVDTDLEEAKKEYQEFENAG